MIIRPVWPKLEFLLHLNVNVDVFVLRSGGYICNLSAYLPLVSMQTCCDPRPLTQMVFCRRDSGQWQEAKCLRQSWRRVPMWVQICTFPATVYFVTNHLTNHVQMNKCSSCKLLFLVIYANHGCSHGCSLENISISSIPATVQVQLVDCITILVRHEWHDCFSVLVIWVCS